MSNINLEKLEQLPDSFFKDITDNPDKVAAQQDQPAQASSLSQEDVFKTGETAQMTFPGETTPGGKTPTISATGAGAKPMQAGSLISGQFATGIMDTMMPALVVLLFGFIGYAIDKRGLLLTQKEKDAITPAMQTYLDSININFNNPLYNLMLVITVTYGAKVIEMMPEIKKKVRRAQLSPSTAVSNKMQDIAQNLEKELAKKKSIEQTNKEVLKLDYAAAIAYITKWRKKGKEDAIEYYNKIKPKK